MNITAKQDQSNILINKGQGFYFIDADVQFGVGTTGYTKLMSYVAFIKFARNLQALGISINDPCGYLKSIKG